MLVFDWLCCPSLRPMAYKTHPRFALALVWGLRPRLSLF